MPDNRLLVEQIMKTSGKRLYALLYRMTLRTNVAEDLLQDLALRLMDTRELANVQSPEGYAVRAAQRLAIDWRRRSHRSAERQSGILEQHDVDVSRADAAADSAEDASVICERRDEFDRVLSALSELSPAQRECIVLRYLDSAEYEEIAMLTGSTSHRVRALICKGIQRLRNLLETRSSACPIFFQKIER